MSRVLVVDDEPNIAVLVTFCLDNLGVEVVQADGLDSALEQVREGDIGLVLLDLALGDEDGLRILPRLREEPNLSGIPVVAFTAHDSRRSEAFHSGVDSFLSRPFQAEQLRSTVELHLVR
ncbi:MAG TPA: response regulator [Acidimicrobiales bacterium]|nr:response regulator [Acidimicrobiales bacterium]